MRILLIAVSSVLFFGCKKENPTVQTCTEYEKTDETFDFIVVTNDLDPTMYQKVLLGGSHIDQEIDINCDGVADFSVKASSDITYGMYDTRSASISFKCLNPNLYVLTHEHNDSIFHLSAIDTFGTTIYSSTTVTNNYSNGSSLDQVNSYTPVQGVNLGDTIYASSTDWKNGQFSIKGHYNSQTDGSQSVGNGYEMYFDYERDTYSGTIQNNQYILIKYVENSVVKMGYISFSATAFLGHTGFNYNFVRMHR